MATQKQRCAIHKDVLFFYIVPLPPTNFTILEEYHDDSNMETTALLGWSAPQGSGPEFVVHNYSVSISPPPQSQSAVIITSSPQLNVTLLQNQEYTVNITSINCAGESMSVLRSEIEFGKVTGFERYTLYLVLITFCAV